MTQPALHVINAMRFGARRDCGSVDHNDRNAQLTCGNDLGLGTFATGIFGHDKIDPVFFHQRPVAFERKGPAIHDDRRFRKAQSFAGRVNQTQDVGMLRVHGKVGQMHTPDSQQHTFSRTFQRVDRSGNVRDVGPLIAGLGLPRRTGVGQKRNARFCAGRDGIAAHLRGKGMRRVDHMGDRIVAQIAGQPFGPAKATNAQRHALRCGPRNASGHGNSAMHSGVCQNGAQAAALGGAAKDQEVRVDG